MKSPHNRPSWRGTENRSQVRSQGGIGYRRWIATVVLTMMCVGLAALSWWKFNQRDPRLLVLAIDGNRVNETEWLDSFACPPLRYTQNTLAALDGLKDKKNIDIVELAASTPQVLKSAIEADKSYRSQDTLIVFAQVQGLTIGDEPYLLTADFSLSDSAIRLPSNDGSIPLRQFLDALVNFPGTKLLALDAGDIVADPQAGSMKNQFVQELHEEIKRLTHDHLWVLVSHGPGEISLDDSRRQEQRRLFGRALTEALTEHWRQDDDQDKTEWLTELAEDGRLSLSELASYVFKRVQADSLGAQSPWIMRSGEGIVTSDERRWPKADLISLFNLESKDRKSGQSRARPPDRESTAQPSNKKAGSSPQDGDATSQASSATSPTEKNDSISPVQYEWSERWKELDKWLQPIPETQSGPSSWSAAELYPQRFRAVRSMLLDMEQRSIAGIPNIDRLDLDLLNPPSLPKQDLDRLSNLFLSPSNASRSRVNPAELAKYQAKAQLLRAMSHASCFMFDAAQLAVRLESIKPGVSASLSKLIIELSEMDERIFAAESDSVVFPELEDIESRTRDIQEIISNQVSLIRERDNPILIESLLQCAGLRAEQRERLWLAKTQRSLKSGPFSAILPTIPLVWLTPATESNLKISPWFEQAVQRPAPSDRRPSESNEQVGTWPDFLIRKDGRILAASGTADRNERSILLNLPSRPPPQPSWQYRWANEAEEQLRISQGWNKIVLYLDPYPVPQLDQKVTIHIRPLPRTIEALKVNGRLKEADQNQITIAWKDIKNNNKQLDIELLAKESEQTLEGQLILGLETLGIPDVAKLDRRLRLVGPERFELQAERQLTRNGEIVWQFEDQLDDPAGIDEAHVINLRPFAGHSSRFRLTVRNRSEIARSVQARVYALPKWDGPAGRIAFGRKILPNFPYNVSDPSKSRNVKLIASSQGLELAANAAGILNFDSVVASTPPTDAEKSNKVVPVSTVDIEVAGGLFVKLVDSANGDFASNYFLQWLPTEAHEYLQANAKVITESLLRKLELEVRYLDMNDDDRPDLGPVDDDPLRLKLFREPWIGKGQLSAILAPATKANQSTAVRLIAEVQKPEVGNFFKDDALVALDVNDSPRVLCATIRLTDTSGDSQRLDAYRENQPRAEIRSIKDLGKDGPIFHRFLPLEPQNVDKLLMGLPPRAFFKSPKELEISLALDLDSDMQQNQPRTFQVKLGNQEAIRFGDRDLDCRWTGTENGVISFDCQLRDHVVNLPTSELLGQDLVASVRTGDKTVSQPLHVIFDQDPPNISSLSFATSSIVQGDSVKLDFFINDLSGCETDFIQLKIGQGSKAKVFELATIQKVSGGAESKYRADFKSAEMAVGKHDFTVHAVDRVGNAGASKSPVSLNIKAPPPSVANAASPSPAPTGTVKGKVSIGKDAPSKTSELTVSIDSTKETIKVDDGTGKFAFKNVPLGPYKIVAEANYQSDRYTGNTTGNLTITDLNPEIKINITKAPPSK